MIKSILIQLSLSLFILCAYKKEDETDLTGVPQLNIKTILTGYGIIWGMDFLLNGDLIFGEKQGTLYRKNNESVTEITGSPEVLSSGVNHEILFHPVATKYKNFMNIIKRSFVYI